MNLLLTPIVSLMLWMASSALLDMLLAITEELP